MLAAAKLPPERLGLIAAQFDFLRFDTSDLIIHKDRAGVEIPVHYRHRETGMQLETMIANFWTFEDGWPVKLSEYHDIARIQAFTANLAAQPQPKRECAPEGKPSTRRRSPQYQIENPVSASSSRCGPGR